MPRRPRLTLPNVPLHLIQRGNNRQACFVADEDYRNYLDWLREYADKAGCRIHAYVLMTNHVHLLVSAERGSASGEMMKALGQRYVQYFNKTYRRSGTLWEGRYRSCPTEAETYLLACQRYIELNPVRAAMVEHPADYRWSSYRANAQGEASPLVSLHEVYLSLGSDAESRQSAYRELFRHGLEPWSVPYYPSSFTNVATTAACAISRPATHLTISAFADSISAFSLTSKYSRVTGATSADAS